MVANRPQPEYAVLTDDNNPLIEKLFDVTCVIGSVYRDVFSNDNPVQVAFRMIADHDAEGHYSFPADGDFTYHVTVEHVSNKEQQS